MGEILPTTSRIIVYLMLIIYYKNNPVRDDSSPSAKVAKQKQYGIGVCPKSLFACRPTNPLCVAVEKPTIWWLFAAGEEVDSPEANTSIEFKRTLRLRSVSTCSCTATAWHSGFARMTFLCFLDSPGSKSVYRERTFLLHNFYKMDILESYFYICTVTYHQIITKNKFYEKI